MSKMLSVIILTEEQYRSVKLRSQILGFKTMSAFAREKLLKNNNSENKLSEIYKKVVGKNG